MKPTTNRESIDGKLVANSVEAFEHGPGAFWFWHNDTRVGIILPGGHIGGISICPEDWQWDGNREQPSFSPSILADTEWGDGKELIELWHGYMTAGRLVSC